MLSIIFALSYDLFFEWIDLTLPIGSELDRVNSAQVGGAIQSKEHSELRIRLVESTTSAQNNMANITSPLQFYPDDDNRSEYEQRNNVLGRTIRFCQAG